MRTYIWPVLALIFLFLLASDAYNARKCDDQPCQTGPCRAFFPMWRFIKNARLCEYFIYGGCQGTRNMFEDEKDCKAQCLN